MPQPLNISGDISCLATAAALSLSAMPVHRQCPMLEVSASIGRLSRVQADRVPALVRQPELLVEVLA